MWVVVGEGQKNFNDFIQFCGYYFIVGCGVFSGRKNKIFQECFLLFSFSLFEKKGKNNLRFQLRILVRELKSWVYNNFKLCQRRFKQYRLVEKNGEIFSILILLIFYLLVIIDFIKGRVYSRKRSRV